MGDVGKRAAAAEAARIILEEFRDAKIVGVGTGSTVALVLNEIASQDPSFFSKKIFAASSIDTYMLLKRYGASAVSLGLSSGNPEIYFDGADELVVTDFCPAIKGRGGAIYLEKLLAYYSNYAILVVDESKLSKRLGSLGKPLPLDIDPSALQSVLKLLENLGFNPQPRSSNSKDGPTISDTGGVIVDTKPSVITNPGKLEDILERIPGVRATGLFVGLFNEAIIGFDDGTVKRIQCKRRRPRVETADIAKLIL